MLAASDAGGRPRALRVRGEGDRGARRFWTASTARIARMTNTTSEFGREMDSLADVISFGIAPAVLAFAWGVQFIDPADPAMLARAHLQRRLLHRVPVPAVLRGAAGALQHPEQSGAQEPGPAGPQVLRRPAHSRGGGDRGRRSFTRRTASRSRGGRSPSPGSALLLLVGFLMVSTWRYYSFKGISLKQAVRPAADHRAGRADLCHVELVAAGVPGDGGRRMSAAAS